MLACRRILVLSAQWFDDVTIGLGKDLRSESMFSFILFHYRTAEPFSEP